MLKLKWYQKLSARMALLIAVIIFPLVGITAYFVADGQTATIEALMKQKGKTAALAGAQAYAIILETGIDSGALRLEDLIDPDHEEIHFPVQVEHRRYRTKYDLYTDTHGVQALQDACLNSSPDFVYCSGMDRKGYVPTPHKKYAAEPTGDFVLDRKQSRAKRMYDEPEQLNAAAFRGNPTNPVLIQDYNRKPGGWTWDIAAPITVKGKHFGGFRVGIPMDRVAEYKSVAMKQLVTWFCYLAIAMIFVSCVLVWAAMRQLTALAMVAYKLSEGEGLETPIIPMSRDEIGLMQYVVEQLRKCLLAAKNLQSQVRRKQT